MTTYHAYSTLFPFYFIRYLLRLTLDIVALYGLRFYMICHAQWPNIGISVTYTNGDSTEISSPALYLSQEPFKCCPTTVAMLLWPVHGWYEYTSHCHSDKYTFVKEQSSLTVFHAVADSPLGTLAYGLRPFVGLAPLVLVSSVPFGQLYYLTLCKEMQISLTNEKHAIYGWRGYQKPQNIVIFRPGSIGGLLTHWLTNRITTSHNNPISK